MAAATSTITTRKPLSPTSQDVALASQSASQWAHLTGRLHRHGANQKRDGPDHPERRYPGCGVALQTPNQKSRREHQEDDDDAEPRQDPEDEL